MSRQQKRDTLRREEWAELSGERALRDDKGIIPRRVRRDMARLKFHAVWRYKFAQEQS
jgi:hypothetical protein